MKKIVAFLFLFQFSCSSFAQSWHFLGSPGFSDTSCQPVFALDKNYAPYIVYADAAHNSSVTVMTYNGSIWQTVGSPGFTDPHAASASIAIDTNDVPYIVFQDQSLATRAATVMKDSGGAWVNVGSPGFTPGSATYTDIAIGPDNSPYIVFCDSSVGGKATVMKFNDTGWAILGTHGISLGTANNTTIAMDQSGVPYVAFSDAGYGNKISVMKYAGGSWQVVGTPGFSLVSALHISLAFDTSGVPYVYYAENSGFPLPTVMRFNGSTWVTLGAAGWNTNLFAGNPRSLAFDNNNKPYIACYTYVAGSLMTNDSCLIMRFDSTGWVSVTSVEAFTGINAWANSIMIKNGSIYMSYMDRLRSGKASFAVYPGSTLSVKNVNPVTPRYLHIFPNPAHNTFTLHLTTSQNETATIIITNILGEKVKQLTASTNEDTEIQLDSPPGVYFVTAVMKEGSVNGKIMME